MRHRRKGRGVGSGHGLARSAGEGSKGQKSHEGGGIPYGFEGGQSPLWRRTPKYGAMHKMFRKELEPLNLEKLQLWIDTGRIDTSKKITMKTLLDVGILSKIENGVKLLAKVSLQRKGGNEYVCVFFPSSSSSFLFPVFSHIFSPLFSLHFLLIVSY